VQGDEPALDPRLIDRLVRTLQKHPKLEMVTAACPFENEADALNPNNVKAVAAPDGRALYFSRSPIPFDRDRTSPVKPLWHIGIYGYRRDFLMKFVRWKPTPLEQTEKLEQLRALEHGATIHLLTTTRHSLGVDTPEDLPRAIAALSPKSPGR
jgi:3-deoxy-manno-octulosonate cytidylyltransferase (CMP-KDO synthetase)